jgi:hypothetical protein
VEVKLAKVTVVIPLGSSEQTTLPGYDPYAITVYPGAKVISGKL